MKVTEQYFLVVLFITLHNVVLTSEFGDLVNVTIQIKWKLFSHGAFLLSVCFTMYVFSKQNNSYSFCAMLNMGALHSRIFIINTESGPTRKLCGVDYCKKEFFPEPKKIIPVPHSGPCGSVQQLRALASQQCHLGSIPRLGVLSGLSLLLVLVLALRGLFPVTCDSNPPSLWLYISSQGRGSFFPSLSQKKYIFI